MVFFPISTSSMFLGLLDQLQIFWQLCLIELIRLFAGLGLLKLYHLIYQGFLHNLKSYGISGQIFDLISSFLNNFWMGSLHKNIRLMMEFLKGPFLVLHISCCTLMTFLIMLSVIIVSMLLILLPTLSLIRHLICGNN